MSSPILANVHSEIGELECVLVHTPGEEVEKMSPTNAHWALYSDILSRQEAQKEHAPFKGALGKISRVLEVKDLLREVLEQPEPKAELLAAVCPEEYPGLLEELKAMDANLLASRLIEGVERPTGRLADFQNGQRFAIPPLFNLFFMRDASMTVFNSVLLGSMASEVRRGEIAVLNAIYRYSKTIRAAVLDPRTVKGAHDLRVEGGDVHIAREDILLVGNGLRSSAEGVDYLVGQLLEKGLEKPLHVLVQELPHAPESFIHLDMVFTLLDRDLCMVYAPLILHSPQFHTIHLEVEPSGKRHIRYEHSLVDALRGLGMPLESVLCGGAENGWNPDREQWHSGANFFSFAPGKIFGYARNTHTIEALSQNGFRVLKAADVASGKVNPMEGGRCVVTLDGNELPRGGGGCRCMTMPFARRRVEW